MLEIEPDLSRFIIIGDTPRDIICAKSARMKCVAVTIGEFIAEGLTEEHKPDLIVENLGSTEKWFSRLIGR